MEYFYSFYFKFQSKFYWNCAIATKFWQRPICFPWICFPLICLKNCCGLQGGLQSLASTSPGNGQGPAYSQPAWTVLWLRVQGELRVSEFPIVELCLGAVMARLSILPWHIVLSSTILEKKTKHGFSYLSHHFLTLVLTLGDKNYFLKSVRYMKLKGISGSLLLHTWIR